MAERFTLLEKIGRGGMGVVWRARDEETGSIVALKLLHSAYSDDPDYVTRFERELELARRIASANVVGVLGYGVREGTPYLVLEYVEGKSLRENLATHGPYTWDETKPLLIQIAQGLTDAHAAGVVHRDIKPSNILIRSDGVAKIADFGIARGLDLTRVTGTSTLLGTPAYLPPEGPQDERSDLYSLGIVTYELLAGVPPFEGSTYAEVLMAHVRLAPDLDKIPAEARPIVGWLLDKDPKLRPQSAAELIATLQGKRKVPAPVAVAAGIAAGAELATRPVRTDAEPLGDRRDRARRGRRMRMALLLSLFVVVLAAGAVWGAQGGFGQGPQPTSSALIAAVGAQQPTGPATADSSALATSTGLTVAITPLGSSTGAGPRGGVTPGGATPTPAAAPPAPPITAPPITAPPAPPVATQPPARPVVSQPPAPPVITPSPAPTPTTNETPRITGIQMVSLVNHMLTLRVTYVNPGTVGIPVEAIPMMCSGSNQFNADPDPMKVPSGSLLDIGSGTIYTYTYDTLSHATPLECTLIEFYTLRPTGGGGFSGEGANWSFTTDWPANPDGPTVLPY